MFTCFKAHEFLLMFIPEVFQVPTVLPAFQIMPPTFSSLLVFKFYLITVPE